MNSNTEQKERLIQQFLDAVGFYRGLNLDLAEQELGTSDNWSFVRGRLLKLWGDRGLSGRITEIINREFQDRL
jgi:hypothetical protein